MEHDVSIVTGIQLMENIDTQKYDILPVYITRDGEWFTGEKLRDIEFVRAFDKNSKEVTKVFLPPVPGHRRPYDLSRGRRTVFQGWAAG